MEIDISADSIHQPNIGLQLHHSKFHSEILHNVQTVYPAEEKINKRWFGDEELEEEKHLELCLLCNCLD